MAQRLVERRPGRGRRIEHHLTPAGERVLGAGHRVADEVLRDCYATSVAGANIAMFVAGLVLIPFSVLGFVAGRITPRLRERIEGPVLLAAGTDTGRLFPNDSAYTTAALVGLAAMALTTLVSLMLARQSSRALNHPVTAVGQSRSRL
ncbi:hypothetical protein [Micromonospora siamensis]|uniref:hypothetical protein n=1 Tax=Micromonospora siamensis TaxID=299152 RepID=UPI0018D5466B|nr:hypothetical protein [Micromonospora siamensis]